MKKIIILLVIVLLLLLGYFVIIKGIQIGGLQIKSIAQIKSDSENLDRQLTQAKTAVSITYPEKVEQVTKAIQELNQVKDQYDEKVGNNEDAKNAITTQIKYYEIDFLWTRLGTYATDRGIELTLDVQKSNTDGAYDLKFTITGEYIGITNFIYDIENDEYLKFKIERFSLGPYAITKSTSTNTTTSSTATNNTVTNNKTTNNTETNNTTTSSKADTAKLIGTFLVVDVGITLN